MLFSAFKTVFLQCLQCKRWQCDLSTYQVPCILHPQAPTRGDYTGTHSSASVTWEHDTCVLAALHTITFSQDTKVLTAWERLQMATHQDSVNLTMPCSTSPVREHPRQQLSHSNSGSCVHAYSWNMRVLGSLGNNILGQEQLLHGTHFSPKF